VVIILLKTERDGKGGTGNSVTYRHRTGPALDALSRLARRMVNSEGIQKPLGCENGDTPKGIQGKQISVAGDDAGGLP